MHEDQFPMDFVASLPSFGILGVASHESASVEAAHPCGRCALSMAMVSSHVQLVQDVQTFISHTQNTGLNHTLNS